MLLSLAQIMAQSTNHLEVEARIPAHSSFQCGCRHLVQYYLRHCRRRVHVFSQFSQSEKVVGKQKAHNLLLAIRLRPGRLHDTRDNVEDVISPGSLLADQLALLVATDSRNEREHRAIILVKQSARIVTRRPYGRNFEGRTIVGRAITVVHWTSARPQSSYDGAVERTCKRKNSPKT